jgi:hypothetical protein
VEAVTEAVLEEGAVEAVMEAEAAARCRAPHPLFHTYSCCNTSLIKKCETAFLFLFVLGLRCLCWIAPDFLFRPDASMRAASRRAHLATSSNAPCGPCAYTITESWSCTTSATSHVALAGHCFAACQSCMRTIGDRDVLSRW